MTMTGDLLGTLRYMSPEQALAKRITVDHRTDIYSLGITLYELLALQPAFNGADREEVLRQIAFEDPTPLRRLKPAIPLELETIIHKSISKNPDDRYATARDLADDLARFCSDQPIRAKPPTRLQRASKWARRHQAVVWSVAICVFVAALIMASSAGWIVRERIERQTVAELRLRPVLAEITRLMDEQKWREQKQLTENTAGECRRPSETAHRPSDSTPSRDRPGLRTRRRAHFPSYRRPPQLGSLRP